MQTFHRKSRKVLYLYHDFSFEYMKKFEHIPLENFKNLLSLLTRARLSYFNDNLNERTRALPPPSPLSSPRGQASNDH